MRTGSKTINNNDYDTVFWHNPKTRAKIHKLSRSHLSFGLTNGINEAICTIRIF